MKRALDYVFWLVVCPFAVYSFATLGGALYAQTKPKSRWLLVSGHQGKCIPVWGPSDPVQPGRPLFGSTFSTSVKSFFGTVDGNGLRLNFIFTCDPDGVPPQPA